MTEDELQTSFEFMQDREDGRGRIQAKAIFKQYSSIGTEDITDWRKRFVATLDPTEYTGGVELTGSWENWQKFKRNWPSFQTMHLDSWLEEIEIVMRSKAIRSLIDASLVKGDVGAAKFLVEGKHQDKLVGRPSKDRIQKQLRIDTAVHKEIANDLERIKEFK